MKKLFLAIFLIGIATVSLSAWEPNDLTKYPSFTKAGDWILNFGVGLGNIVYVGNGNIYIPPVRLSFDINTPLGEASLPFFFGGIVGYSGQGNQDWFVHKIPVGIRFGYHFNWDVDNLDTYAVTTTGWVIHAGKDYGTYFAGSGNFFWDVSIGVRYFLNKGFGFWAEAGAGWNSLSYIDIGLSFKF